jgi:hypothetical protein
MRGQKRVEDARKRAYDPRIHLLRGNFVRNGWIASQLGLARVAQDYAPQLGLARVAQDYAPQVG